MSQERGARRLSRPVQAVGKFDPTDPLTGYYNDLRRIAAVHGTPARAGDELRRLTSTRERANPVSIAQLGLAAWQLRGSDASWLEVSAGAARWLADELDQTGRLAYLFPMPHTFRLAVPWYSAMAQGEAVSLLVRAAATVPDDGFATAAEGALAPLLDPDLGLIAETPEGPVLQEYPTTPPAHVLNGWIFALWGLHDAALSGSASAEAADRAFRAGTDALARRLPRYEVALGWSRYDLFPHPIVHVASPFYHLLHTAQLQATARLRPDVSEFAETAARWDRTAARPLPRALALTRKVAFRILRPRRRSG
jgi:heparosan-N-sulfate-glucuronate 5-epimerase